MTILLALFAVLVSVLGASAAGHAAVEDIPTLPVLHFDAGTHDHPSEPSVEQKEPADTLAPTQIDGEEMSWAPVLLAPASPSASAAPLPGMVWVVVPPKVQPTPSPGQVLPSPGTPVSGGTTVTLTVTASPSPTVTAAPARGGASTEVTFTVPPAN